MDKIRLRIKDQASLGIKRSVVLHYIQIDLVSNVASFTVKEKYITSSDLDADDIDTRLITVDISNTVKVTPTGIPITLEFIKSTRQIRVDETPEHYEIRMHNRLQTELSTGLKQFDFWIDQIINPLPTLELLKIFNSLGKFD